MKEDEEEEDEESEESDGDGGTLSTYSQLTTRRHHDSKATRQKSSPFARLYSCESTFEPADHTRTGILT